MPADQRRELILDAAMRAFAAAGYAGTSTDAVAREAGVSQPYVVRMFGTKLDLFLAVFERACRRIDATFRGVLDAAPFDPESEDDRRRLGQAYAMLLSDSDLLHVMMHGFSVGMVPEIGSVGREWMGRIVETLRTGTGWDDEQVRAFVAHGMLLTVLLSMQAFDAPDAVQGPLADLVRTCIPEGAGLPAAGLPSYGAVEA